MRQRAVITGGAGFLGSHLAERLLDQDFEVICLDNFITGSPANVEHLREHDGFRLVRCDVSEFIHVAGPVDYVLHFASPASPIDYAEIPIETLKVGSLGTMNALGLAKEKGARFLLASTSESYGDPQEHPQREDYWGHVNPVGPRSMYDEAKRFAEATTMAYRNHHGVDTAIMRIFNTYGPRMRPNDGRAIPTFVTQALAGEPITVAGDGLQTRSVCYVDDLIDGALRLLFSDEVGPINIGNPNEMSILELAEHIREMTNPDAPIEFIPRPTDDPTVRQPDITLAREKLGWEPEVSLDEGLKSTIAWFAKTGTSTVLAPVQRTRAISADAASRGPESSNYKIAVIGTGYVGAVTSTCMAMLGHEVWGLDTDPVRAGQLSAGQVPFYEPGLSEQVTAAIGTGRLQFTDDRDAVLGGADVIFLCVGTPPSANGTPDLSQVESAARSVAPYLRDGTVVVNKSTVPVGSGNWVRTLLEDALPRHAVPAFHVVSNPEFLREGSAIDDFLYPDRIVLGGEKAGVDTVAELYRPVLDQSFAAGRRRTCKPVLITTELASAEMIKYAANAFLATKISFANEIATISELVGADSRQVLPAIGADHRIAPAFLSAGVGWGGSCFGKDVAALMAAGQEYGHSPAILRAAVDVNQMQRAAVVRKLQRELRVLKGRRIAILGLAFKPGTDDLRDAPALDIARRLIAAGAVVSAYDPMVKKLPEDLSAVRTTGDAYDAAERVDAVVLATEWPEFAEIDPTDLREVMKGDLVLDGRNFLDEDSYAAAGMTYVGFGR